jgi:hypothetical protein
MTLGFEFVGAMLLDPKAAPVGLGLLVIALCMPDTKANMGVLS